MVSNTGYSDYFNLCDTPQQLKGSVECIKDLQPMLQSEFFQKANGLIETVDNLRDELVVIVLISEYGLVDSVKIVEESRVEQDNEKQLLAMINAWTFTREYVPKGGVSVFVHFQFENRRKHAAVMAAVGGAMATAVPVFLLFRNMVALGRL